MLSYTVFEQREREKQMKPLTRTIETNDFSSERPAFGHPQSHAVFFVPQLPLRSGEISVLKRSSRL